MVVIQMSSYIPYLLPKPFYKFQVPPLMSLLVSWIVELSRSQIKCKRFKEFY